jgi:uncharacterized metal-binding protein YceD (DUF177 family)
VTALEFSRRVDLRQCDGRAFDFAATPVECAALAQRFSVVRIDRLEARLVLDRAGEAIAANGQMEADLVQSCALSAEDLPTCIAEPLTLRFVPASANHAPDADIEIDSGSEDEIEYAGTEIDLGEAIAQSLALAIDPFVTGPQAAAARERLGGESASPFAALAALKHDSAKKPGG